MRVVSMVPSWTETLIEAGIDVVGRTRFCIHPEGKIKSIPVVGGTKDLNWEKLKAVSYDVLLLDKEENPKHFAEAVANDSNARIVATHVKRAEDVIVELRKLAEVFKSEKLGELAERWESVVSKLNKTKGKGLTQLHHLSPAALQALGIQEWIKKPEADYDDVVYVIWKNPYMAVVQETFVGSMLELLGLKTSLTNVQSGKSYPEVDLQTFDSSKTLFLFSSEPFPFHKKVSELKALDLNSAIVDGESFSWFGVRALKFLESQRK